MQRSIDHSVGANSTGGLVVLYGPGLSQYSYNITASNCVFRHAIWSIVSYGYISNLMAQNSEFLPWDTNNSFDGATKTRRHKYLRMLKHSAQTFEDGIG